MDDLQEEIRQLLENSENVESVEAIVSNDVEQEWRVYLSSGAEVTVSISQVV